MASRRKRSIAGSRSSVVLCQMYIKSCETKPKIKCWVLQLAAVFALDDDNLSHSRSGVVYTWKRWRVKNRCAGHDDSDSKRGSLSLRIMYGFSTQRENPHNQSRNLMTKICTSIHKYDNQTSFEVCFINLENVNTVTDSTCVNHTPPPHPPTTNTKHILPFSPPPPPPLLCVVTSGEEVYPLS